MACQSYTRQCVWSLVPHTHTGTQSIHHFTFVLKDKGDPWRDFILHVCSHTPTCMPPPHGRLDEHGYEPSQASELPSGYELKADRDYHFKVDNDEKKH